MIVREAGTQVVRQFIQQSVRPGRSSQMTLKKMFQAAGQRWRKGATSRLQATPSKPFAPVCQRKVI